MSLAHRRALTLEVCERRQMSYWITWWGTGFEPVTSSVSGNGIDRSCFRILLMSCGVWSADVHGRMSLSRTVVTRLVTHLGPRVCPGSQSAWRAGPRLVRRFADVGLSAWELACHACLSTVYAGQEPYALSVDDRYRPSQTLVSGTQRARRTPETIWMQTTGATLLVVNGAA